MSILDSLFMLNLQIICHICEVFSNSHRKVILRVYNLQIDDDKQFRVAAALWGWIWVMKGQRFRITFQQQNTLRMSTALLHRILETGRHSRHCRLQFANILGRFIATKHKHIGPLTCVREGYASLVYSKH